MNPTRAYNPTRRVDMEILFQLIDVNAADNCTVISTDKSPNSYLPALLHTQPRDSRKLATMETGLVQTDGTWDVTQDGTTVPYWSKSVSGFDGRFKKPPTLEFLLSAPATVAGFTLEFDPVSLPKELQIEAYSGTYMVEGKSVTVDGPTIAVDMVASGFDRVVLSFKSTREPYRRIRMRRFIFGKSMGLTGDDIVSATIKSGCSPVCASIPSAQLDFTVDNSGRQFNILSPAGLFGALQQGQPIDTYISIDGVKVHTGRFYFTRVKSSDGSLTAHITANDKVLTWDGEDYDKGTESSISFRSAIKEVLGDGYQYDIPAETGEILVSRNIRPGTSKRKAAQLMCQAARCTMWLSRNGTVTCRDLQAPGVVIDTFDGDNMYSFDGITAQSLDQKAPVDKIMLKYAGLTHIAGTGDNTLTLQAPSVTPASAQKVAEWLLSLYRMRILCDFKNRGNPALLTGDTVQVYNVFGQPEKAVIYDQTLTFNGGLSAQTKAIGRPWE